MTEMRAINADSLSVWQASHIFPDDLLITEAWPSMLGAFIKELFRCAASRRDKKRLTRDGIVIGDFSLGLDVINPGAGLSESIA